MFALVLNEVVTDVLSVDPALVYDVDRAAQYQAAPDGVEVGWLYAAGVFTPPPLVVEVPPLVSRRQARQQLRMDGLLSSVQPAIDAIEDELQRDIAQIYWDDSQEFERHHPLLMALGSAMGLTAVQMDELFIRAAALQ